jgi:hypothetical protein
MGTILGWALLAGCGTASSNNPDGGNSNLRPRPNCEYSTAASGSGLCQVNFFCSPELAMYCTAASCSCRKAGAIVREFDDANMCAREGDARVDSAVQKCEGWE